MSKEREALAEQPAQHQEPVTKPDPLALAGTYTRANRGYEIRHAIDHYPPASKPWVGLTEDDMASMSIVGTYPTLRDWFMAVEAKLREKNAP